MKLLKKQIYSKPDEIIFDLIWNTVIKGAWIKVHDNSYTNIYLVAAIQVRNNIIL